jgi:hypothetical protein
MRNKTHQSEDNFRNRSETLFCTALLQTRTDVTTPTKTMPDMNNNQICYSPQLRCVGFLEIHHTSDKDNQ